MSEVVNYFSELAKIDVSKYVEKKGKFTYLSWTFAVDQLKKRHPDATWEVKRFGADQLPFLKTETGYFVEVPVTVNGITLSQLHPVLDNNNRPIEKPNAFQINTSIQRGLVKSIALHGLGLYIYAGEDLPEVDSADAPAPVVNTPAPNAREEARARAAAKVADKKTTETPTSTTTASSTDGLPFDEQSVETVETVETATVEPINDNQIKAIGNMLKMLVRKKADVDETVFLDGVIKGFGKTNLKELSFVQAKEVVIAINAEMRK